MKKSFIFASVAFAALLLASVAVAAPLISFEDLTTGADISGAGAAYPSLIITPTSPGVTDGGNAIVIETGLPGAFGAPNDNLGPAGAKNNGLEDADGVRVNKLTNPEKTAKGFANLAANAAGKKQEFDFSFVGGVTVSQFSIRVFDWSDFKPPSGTEMGIQLTAKDVGDNIVDQKTVSLTNVQNITNPKSATFNSATINPWYAGDAITASFGEPGYLELSVASPTGIAKVEFRMLDAWDPNIGFDSINFTKCNRTIGYWKNHTWGDMTVTINDETITELIGRSNPVDLKPGNGILWEARGRNFSMLFAQLIAAELNLLSGGGDGGSILGVVQDAEDLLVANGVGVSNYYQEFSSKQVKREAADLASQLDTFNNSYPCECQQSQ